jgi:hypothetical protein
MLGGRQAILALLRRSSMDMLWYVADGEVDGVRQFSTELCQVSFVG